jgi:hypothetical protein
VKLRFPNFCASSPGVVPTSAVFVPAGVVPTTGVFWVMSQPRTVTSLTCESAVTVAFHRSRSSPCTSCSGLRASSSPSWGASDDSGGAWKYTFSSCTMNTKPTSPASELRNSASVMLTWATWAGWPWGVSILPTWSPASLVSCLTTSDSLASGYSLVRLPR